MLTTHILLKNLIFSVLCSVARGIYQKIDTSYARSLLDEGVKTQAIITEKFSSTISGKNPIQVDMMTYEFKTKQGNNVTKKTSGLENTAVGDKIIIFYNAKDPSKNCPESTLIKLTEKKDKTIIVFLIVFAATTISSILNELIK